MVRKTLLRIMLLMLVMLLPAAALAETRIFDRENLFTPVEEQRMQEIITAIQDSWQMDVVVVTSSEPEWDGYVEFADDFYDAGGFGLDEEASGMLYLIDMHNRVPYIYTAGRMIDILDDARLDDLFDRSYDDLAAGNYGASTITLLERVTHYLRIGVAEGQYRYDEETGERLTQRQNPLTQTEILVSVLIGLAAAGLMYLMVWNKYHLKGSTYSYNAAENTSCDLKDNIEVFANQTVTRRPRVQTSSSSSSRGGSGVHRSSSGRSHGGGRGRGF